jgi:lipopolysaccharide transport system permease protein
MEATSLPGRGEARVVKPASRWPTLGLGELWRYRELLYFLALRELKVRYKQTGLGVAWAMLQPVGYMVVFTLFFGKVADFYSEGKPYALLVLSGSVIWLYFANSVTLGSGSLVGNASLLTKVYFPRLRAPISPTIAALVDLLLGTIVLVVIMAFYGMYPAPERVWVAIPFVILAWGTAVGVGSFLAAVNVKYRDVRFVVPFLLQLWLFASPVAYSAALLSEPWDLVFRLNPMAGAVEGFRWAFLGGVRPAPSTIALSTATGMVMLIAGVFYFRKMERQFADIV